MSPLRAATRSLLLVPLLACSACFADRQAAGTPTTTLRDPPPVESTSTSTTSTTSTTVPPPPPLPAPAPITPLVSPALAGEGSWQPAVGAKLPRGYAVYTTQLRPAAGYPAAGVAWIDTPATRVTPYAGFRQPVGTWTDELDVATSSQPNLLAAFNAGFKMYSGYSTGWYDQGVTAVALRPGAASLVTYSDGRATVGEWGRDVSLTASVVAVRQHLNLLVDQGRPVPGAAVPSEWGAVFGGGTATWRSGVGVTPRGDLVYVAGPELTPAALANLLVAAGAWRAMEMDINYSWVSFATFSHTGGIAGTPVVGGTSLVATMAHPPNHYLAPYTRDFFAVFARP